MKISIVGAGIAGLAMAVALKRAGFDPELFEAAPAVRAAGAGLGLAPNAIKALAALGLAEQVVPLGRALPYFRIQARRGTVLTHTDSRAVSARYGLDNFAIHRAALHQALLQALGDVPIHTGKQAIGLIQDGNAVQLAFQDGSLHQTPYLVVADGIQSALRRQLVPHSVPRYAGYSCWRAVVDAPDLDVPGAFETWDPAGRFGLVPLRQGQLYWFACLAGPAQCPAFKAYTLADLQQQFQHFHDPVPAVLARTTPAQLLHHDIYDLEPLDRFAYGNVLLVGDAAHGMTPNLGQGACQALEDAVVLGAILRQQSGVREAFQEFERQRLPRTGALIRQSRRVGEVAQTTNPLLAALRNTLLRLAPGRLQQRQFDQLYNVQF
ncbi:FAD-dependent monooxygenase [Hymenobacter sp. B81]|uniref:FAD-dependent monooxygenase n=1 Tax=Hymenobacter sp. B81 TaxID=3344878 RepID=UPI0037DC2CDA